MTTQRWITLLLVSLSIALVAMGWLARSSFCLDSILVKKLDMVGPNGTVSILACSSKKDSPFSEDLYEIKTDLEMRLRSIERNLEFLGVDAEPVHISIVKSLDPLVRVHASHLILSESALGSKNLLEKALLESLLMQKNGNLDAASEAADKVLWSDVFSDVILASTQGYFELGDPLLNQNFNWNARRSEWPFSLRTKTTYCQDASRSLLHLAACQQGQLKPEDLFVSLRPFFGKALFDSLQSLSNKQRVQWFSEVWRHWPELQIERGYFGASVGPDEKQQLADAAIGIRIWMANFRNWATRGPIWAQLAKEMAINIQKQGFREQTSTPSADLLVIVNDHDSEAVLQGLREAALMSTGKSILVFRNSDAWMMPDMRPFPKVWLGDWQVQQAILIQCEIPSTEKLQALAEHAQNLMLIRICKSNPLQWGRLAQGGVNAFLRDNPSVPFIQFHLPSLKSALAKRNLNPVPLIEEENWKSPFFEGIGWQKPQWDQDLKIYRSHSAIEVIKSYRLGAPASRTL